VNREITGPTPFLESAGEAAPNKSAMRQMTIATVDFPLKREIVCTLFRAAGVFSRKAA